MIYNSPIYNVQFSFFFFTVLEDIVKPSLLSFIECFLHLKETPNTPAVTSHLLLPLYV